MNKIDDKTKDMKPVSPSSLPMPRLKHITGEWADIVVQKNIIADTARELIEFKRGSEEFEDKLDELLYYTLSLKALEE